MERDDKAPAETPAPLSSRDRREFLQRASRYAVTAPATALLLQAATKPVNAAPYGPVETTTLNVPSDRRLKTDIRRESTLANGLALYSFRYTFSRQRFVGVMADEVEAVMPQAVSVHRSGYKMVNYAMVLG